jgi:uncharacterized membrane protein YbhN (UPF0104 family)
LSHVFRTDAALQDHDFGGGIAVPRFEERHCGGKDGEQGKPGPSRLMRPTVDDRPLHGCPDFGGVDPLMPSLYCGAIAPQTRRLSLFAEPKRSTIRPVFHVSQGDRSLNTGDPKRQRIVRIAKLVFRLLVLTLVGIGIWHTVVKAIDELQAKGFTLGQIQFGWLAVAALLYLAGLVPCWLFWHRTLRAMGQQPRRFESFRAFYIGHLGKYVPGKALVVIIRTGLIRGDRVDTTVAATSVFVETLTMMAVGAFVAAGILGALFREHLWLLALAIGLMVCAGGPTLPPIFRRLVRMVGVKKINPDIDAALAGLDFRLMVYGWVTVALGWGLLGLSLWATLQSIPTITAAPVTVQDVPLVTACVALAMVAGFLSLLPGGIGIREYVVMTLLAGPFGAGAAAVSAVLLRLTWLTAELVLASQLYLAKPAAPRQEKTREAAGGSLQEGPS